MIVDAISFKRRSDDAINMVLSLVLVFLLGCSRRSSVLRAIINDKKKVERETDDGQDTCEKTIEEVLCPDRLKSKESIYYIFIPISERAIQ
jgi:hypothetical protein